MDHVSKHRQKKAADGTATPQRCSRMPVEATTPPPKAPKPRRVPPTAAQRDERLKAKGRLPAGSYYETPTWDGTQWTSALVIFIGPRTAEGFHPYARFPGTGPDLFRLLECLDDAYRDSLKAKEQP